MRYFIILLVFLQGWIGPAWAVNDKGFPTTVQNQEAKEKDFHGQFVASGCDWVVPSSSLTLAAVTCEAYMLQGAFLKLANQDVATAITLPAVDGTHWLAMRADTTVTPVGYTALFGAHFIHQQSATRPLSLDGVQIVAQVTVLTVITAVIDERIPRSFATAHVYAIDDPIYGAVCDGTNDDTVAFQAAVTAARGRQVQLPGRTCVVTSTIVHTTTTTTGSALISGQGRFNSLIDNRVANGCALTLESTVLLAFQQGGRLQDFGIFTSTDPVASDGLCIKAVYQLVTENLHIIGLTGDGIQIDLDVGDADGPNQLIFNELRVENNGGAGMFVDTVGTAVENSFMRVSNSFFQNNAAGGIDYKGLILTIENTAFVQNKGLGGFLARFDAVNNRNISIRDSDFENNEPIAAEFSSVANLEFTNNECIKSVAPVTAYTHCYRIGGAVGALVQNAYFSNNFIRVLPPAMANPFTAYEINTQADTTIIERTHWATFDDTGQTRFSDNGTNTRICDRDIAGLYSCRPTNTSLLRTTFATTAQTYTPDSTQYEFHAITVTAAAPATLTIADPTVGSFVTGRILTFDIFNDTGGQLTVTWGGLLLQASTYIDPPDGERALVRYQFDNAIGWILIGFYGTSVGSGGNLVVSASLDFGVLAADACEILTITALGVSDRDVCALGVDATLAASDLETVFFCYSSANIITVKRCNVGAGATADPAAATVFARAWTR